MSRITTEARWLACEEPPQLGYYAAGRVGTQRFRWLAVDWGGRVRHTFESDDLPWLDAFTAWVAGLGEHPREVCENRMFDPLDRPMPHLAWTRRCADAIRQDDPLRVAAAAGASAIWDCCLSVPLPRTDPSRTHLGRSAAKRAADKARADAHREAWWDARKVHEARVSRDFCDQFRDVAGNPFRPVVFAPAWLTADVRGLAETVDALRAFDRLPILADALQDAGCDCDDVLAHCRGPGPHVRGCWAVDGLLGRL